MTKKDFSWLPRLCAIFRFDHRIGFACLQVEASRHYSQIRVDPLTKLDQALYKAALFVKH